MEEHECPFCLKIGKIILLQLYQINYKEAVYMCPEKDCKYPENSNYIFVQRELFDNNFKAENDSTESDIEEITRLFTERARKKINKKCSFESLLSDQEGSNSNDEEVIKKAYDILLGNVLKNDIDHVKILEENAELLGIMSQEKNSHSNSVFNKNIISNKSDINVRSLNLSSDSFNSSDALDLEPVLEDSPRENESKSIIKTYKTASDTHSSKNNTVASQQNISEYCSSISKISLLNTVKDKDILCQSQENCLKDTILSNNVLEERPISDISILLDDSQNERKIDVNNIQNLLNISQDIQVNVPKFSEKYEDKNLCNKNKNRLNSINTSSSLNDISKLLDFKNDLNQEIPSNSNQIEKCLEDQSNASINNDNAKQSFKDTSKLVDAPNDIELVKTANKHHIIIEPISSQNVNSNVVTKPHVTKSENIETILQIQSNDKDKIKHAIPIKIKVLNSVVSNKVPDNLNIKVQTLNSNKMCDNTNKIYIKDEVNNTKNNIFKLVTNKNLDKAEISRNEILGLKQFIKTSSTKNKFFQFRNRTKKKKVELSKVDISAALRASGVTENSKLNTDVIKKPTQICMIPGRKNKTTSHASRFEGFNFTTKIIKPANAENDNKKLPEENIKNLTVTKPIIPENNIIDVNAHDVASLQNLKSLTAGNNSVELESTPMTVSPQKTDVIDDFLQDIDLNISTFTDDNTDTNLEDVDDWLKSLVN